MFMDSFEQDEMSRARFLRSHPEAWDTVMGAGPENFPIFEWLRSLLDRLFWRR